MSAFKAMETVQILASQDSKSITFSNKASLEAPHVLISNEGINTVYVSFGKEASVPTDEPSLTATPVLPMREVPFIKEQDQDTISLITANGESKVNITTGQLS